MQKLFLAFFVAFLLGVLPASAQYMPGGGGGSTPAGSTYAVQYNAGSVLGGAGPGISGYVLTSNGSGSAPTFQAVAGTGTVTSVTFTGDGIIDSSTPSSAVTGAGTVTATPLTTSQYFYLGRSASGTGAFSFQQISFPQLSGSVAASQMPAFTGDITTSAGAVATTLATVNSNVGSFTNASITLNGKGLVTAASNGTAPVTSFTGDSTVLNNSASTGTVTATLANAAAYSVLANNTGSSATPTYAQSGVLLGQQAITASTTTLTASSPTLNYLNNTSNSVAVTLPGASAAPGKIFIFEGTGTAGNAVTITRAGSDTIEAVTSVALGTGSLYSGYTLISDGISNWRIIGLSPIAGWTGATSGQILSSSGSATVTSWNYGWLKQSSTAITAASTTLTNASNSYQAIDNTSNSIAITLPGASTCAGKIFFFKHTNGTTGANTITISRAGSDTIDGQTSMTLSGAAINAYMGIESDGTSKWSMFTYVPSVVTGNLFYTNSSGVLAALGIGSTNGTLQVQSGLPAWTNNPVFGNVTLNHEIGGSSAPTIAAGAGAGTSPGAITITGTDSAGQISVTTGTLPSISSVICTVTFNAAYGSTPYVVFSAANGAAALGAAVVYAVAPNASTFTLSSDTTALTAATTYVWNYTVSQ
jgi:hypothetical protein